MFHQILAIEPDAGLHRIKITYTDHVAVNVDFSDLMDKGVMRRIKNPDDFNQVQIGNKGRSIIWKEQDIDFCADSLRLRSSHPKP